MLQRALPALMLVFLLFGIGGAVRLALVLGQPIPGFGFQWRLELGQFTVSWMNPTYWPGFTAGVRINDRLLCVDGYQPIAEFPSHGQAVHYSAPRCPNGSESFWVLFGADHTSAGTPAHIDLLVERGGRLALIQNVPLAPFTLSMLAEVFFPTFLLGLGLLLVGFVVFRAGPVNEINQVFALVTLIGAGLALDQPFTIVLGDRFADTRWVTAVLVIPGLPLFGPLLFHLVSLLIDAPRLIAFSHHLRRPYYILGLSFSLLGLFAYATLDYPISARLDWPYLRFVIYSAGFSASWGILCLVWTYLRSPDRRIRNQARLILAGLIILALCATPLAIYFLSAAPPTSYLHSLPYLALGFVAITAYAILRYQLFRARGNILKGLLLVSFCIVLANLICLLTGARAEFLPILIVALVTGLAVEARRGPTAFFDRLMRREAVDYRVVADFSQEVAGLQELPTLTRIVNRRLSRALDTAYLYIWLYDAERQTLDCYSAERVIDAVPVPEGLIEAWHAQGEPLRVDAAQAGPYETLRAAVIDQDIAVWAPLVEGEQVVGMLGLGPRWTGEIYDEADLRLLSILARLTALSVLNTRQLQRLRVASQMILQAEENERRKIARELHDTILQFLLVLTYGLDELKERSPALAAQLNRWQDRISAEASQLRDLLGYLRAPEMLVQRGLAVALRGWIAQVQSETTVQLCATFSDQVETQLSAEAKVAIYRVFREAIHNALKHADAATIIARLTLDGQRVGLLIQDDGCGFVPEEALRPGTKGYTSLQDMQAYIESVNGRLEIRSAPGAGATIVGSVPVLGGRGSDHGASNAV